MDKADEFALPDAAKLEAMAEFAAGAGHEINNPLATIIGRAQLLLRDETDPQRRQMLMSIGAQAYRIRDMIGDTMLFARPPAAAIERVCLRDTIETVVGKLADELKSGRCTVKIQCDAAIQLKADRSQLSVVLSELIRNSRQSLQSDGGEILVSAVPHEGNAILEISDSGRGFSEIERQHAFDPFFSGRQAGRGLGFGLAKCWRIVGLHGGRIEIQSLEQGPTTVRIRWPIAANC